MYTEETRTAVAKIVKQIRINPENAPGEDGGHVGLCLSALFMETAWPTRATQDN